MDRFGYPVEVLDLGSRHTAEVMNWLENNIGYWGNKWTRTYGEKSIFKTVHVYYFTEEKDAIMFALRWK